MKIKYIKINQGFYKRTFTFSDTANLIFSTENSVGKTTLLRLILWGIGYDVPSTKKFNFDKCNTQICVELDNKNCLEVYRTNDTLVVNNGHEEQIYSLPMEAIKFHSILYNSNNPDIVNNIIGAIYLDQEKGWTLLNRGCVVGKIHFKVETLIRGLSNIDCTELLAEEKKLEFEIAKYKKMLDLSEYQRQINDAGGKVFYQYKDDEIRTKIATLQYKQSQIKEELNRISSVIKENNSFKNYIERMHLTVISPNTGEEIPVNKSTINGYEDVQQIALARKKIQLMELQKITKKIEDLTMEIDDSNMIERVETLIESFDAQVLNIPIDAIAVKNVIEQLTKRKKEICDYIKIKTKTNNAVIGEIYKIAWSYVKELNVDKFADENESYLFTHDLKSLSGAVLHLTVFAFRLAYIKAIEAALNITLPIIIDSPSGKEVQKDNVEKMMNILERDFPNNQVIIASIYKYEIDNLKVHTIVKSLMGEEF